MKRIIKTIFLVLIMQLVGVTANATDFEPIKSDSRPGDGKNKYNPRHKQGESLKGYFYRVYGDKRVFAEKIKFKGPFKLKKVKKFLKKCQEQFGGYVQEDFTTQTHEEKYKFYFEPSSFWLDTTDYGKIFHVTLHTRVSCIVFNKIILTQEWAAVYLDNDRGDDKGLGAYIDYDYCSDNRAYLAIGEYSIHYDQNPKCHADVSKKE